MSTLDQEVDSIIAEEKLESTITPDEENKDGEVSVPGESEQSSDSNNDKEDLGDGDDGDKNEESDESKKDDDAEGDDKDGEDTDEEESESEEDDSKVEKQVEEAKTLISRLTEGGLKVFDDKGNARDFEEVIPPGQYFMSQLDPVKVTDKDGKEHTFLLLSDVEKKFPDGFEAKNNIEQMKFERDINKNESKFDQAISNYNNAKQMYDQEMGEATNVRAQQASYASEYKAMAKEGLVPEVGDPNDPKFGESDAVKELDKILEWMDNKNKELTKKGLGQINSLYIAKQLMDQENDKSKNDEDKSKDEEKKKIDEQRKKVASLSNAPSSADKDDGKKKVSPSMSMPNFVEQLIAEEDLK